MSYLSDVTKASEVKGNKEGWKNWFEKPTIAFKGFLKTSKVLNLGFYFLCNFQYRSYLISYFNRNFLVLL